MKNMKRILFALLAALMLAAFAAPFAHAADSSSYAGKVTTSSMPLNVRSGAGASYSIVTSLPSQSLVTVISKSGSWYRVEYAAGKYGYCSSSYISAVSGSYAAYVSLSSGYLNVRSGAGTGYGITGTLNNGACVVVLGSSGGWFRVLYGGAKTGYVNGSYIKASASSAYSKISLSVPSYKQTDSRWSSVMVGNSGNTIGQIGCTTTALAMTESYRRGYTVTPAAMESELSYTSGGSVYWPSNYTFSTSSSYLSVIYSKLASGKPVIIGSKTASGSLHFVVVTGFTGGNTLSSSGFTINDPGSSSRTTLSQFLAVYPYFYKLAFYN
jgi:uncharacterized protein YgiM (DUF1202 family)